MSVDDLNRQEATEQIRRDLAYCELIVDGLPISSLSMDANTDMLDLVEAIDEAIRRAMKRIAKEIG